MWAWLALASAGCFGIIGVVDKRLLDHHLPSVSALYLWIALVLVLYVAVVLGITGIPRDVPATPMLVALTSGMSIGVALALMFVGLKLEEASRAIAITQIYPVFVAFLAVVFLGETLNRIQWSSIALVVVGTMLISLHEAPGRRLLRLTWGTPILIGSGLFLGFAFFAAKYALDGLPVWTVFTLQQSGNILAFSVFARPKVFRELFGALRNRNTLILLVVAEGIMPIVAIFTGLQAISMGPVSLVSAFLATSPLFVFVISTVLSKVRWRISEESLGCTDLALKFVSIVMIAVGVSALGFR